MLPLGDLTFHAAFHKTLRVIKESGASEAGQVSQPVQAKRVNRAVYGKFRSIFRFGTFVFVYFTLVDHLNKVWLVILQDTLVGHIKSVI